MRNLYPWGLHTSLQLRELTSCLCSAAAWAVCFEASVAGVNATETGNEVSQPTLEFTPLVIYDEERFKTIL